MMAELRRREEPGSPDDPERQAPHTAWPGGLPHQNDLPRVFCSQQNPHPVHLPATHVLQYLEFLSTLMRGKKVLQKTKSLLSEHSMIW